MARGNTRIVPALVLIILDDCHVIGEDPARSGRQAAWRALPAGTGFVVGSKRDGFHLPRKVRRSCLGPCWAMATRTLGLVGKLSALASRKFDGPTRSGADRERNELVEHVVAAEACSPASVVPFGLATRRTISSIVSRVVAAIRRPKHRFQRNRRRGFTRKAAIDTRLRQRVDKLRDIGGTRTRNRTNRGKIVLGVGPHRIAEQREQLRDFVVNLSGRSSPYSATTPRRTETGRFEARGRSPPRSTVSHQVATSTPQGSNDNGLRREVRRAVRQLRRVAAACRRDDQPRRQASLGIIGDDP